MLDWMTLYPVYNACSLYIAKYSYSYSSYSSELGGYSKEVEMATLHDAITNIPNQWNTLVARRTWIKVAMCMCVSECSYNWKHQYSSLL